MPVRKANAEWEGTLKDGNGRLRTETGAVDGRYSFSSRFEEGTGTNPEELIGAAHAGCFSMAFSGALVKSGYTPRNIRTEDKVYVEKIGDGFTITKIEMSTEADVPDIDEETFLRIADDAKNNCPVSRALKGVDITLNARLRG